MSPSYFRPGLFRDKKIVITGAGRGIGAALAHYLLSDGAHLMAHLGREENRSNKQINLKAQESSKCKTVYADLATVAGIDGLVQATRAEFSAIDVLINNAGTMLGRVMSEQMSLEHYTRVTDLNARSVVMLTTQLLPLLANGGSASIVNVSSISANTGGSAGSSIYSAAKGFVSTYTRSLATELAPQGIRVNAISPGTIDTDFHKRYSTEEKLRSTAEKTPLKRLGLAQDCVPACLFFAADELSGFITGQILGINGGLDFY